jgi:MazG family protein
MSGLPRSLPALLRADQLGQRAARVGFDWEQPSDVLHKIDEEVREFREAVETEGMASAHAEEEFGDLLFALTNLARKMGIAPETALRKANDKFQRRFEAMESAVRADGRSLKQLSFSELDERWNAAKTATAGR